MNRFAMIFLYTFLWTYIFISLGYKPWNWTRIAWVIYLSVIRSALVDNARQLSKGITPRIGAQAFYSEVWCSFLECENRMLFPSFLPSSPPSFHLSLPPTPSFPPLISHPTCPHPLSPPPTPFQTTYSWTCFWPEQACKLDSVLLASATA